MQHPNKEIMIDLINKQWQNHSIYAAVITNDGVIISEGTTTVAQSCDPTAHAEVNAIREASRLLKTSQFPSGYWLYSTFEPCPLCSSAAIWAGLDGIVYANNPTYRGDLPNWSFIRCADVLEKGRDIHQVTLYSDYLIEEIKGYFTRHKKDNTKSEDEHGEVSSL